MKVPIKEIVKVEKKEHGDNCRYFGNFLTSETANIACDCGASMFNEWQDTIGNKSVNIDVEKLGFLLFKDYVVKKYYNKKSWEEYKNAKHSGDCTNECHSCLRCQYEDIIDKAKAISNNLKDLLKEGK